MVGPSFKQYNGWPVSQTIQWLARQSDNTIVGQTVLLLCPIYRRTLVDQMQWLASWLGKMCVCTACELADYTLYVGDYQLAGGTTAVSCVQELAGVSATSQYLPAAQFEARGSFIFLVNTKCYYGWAHVISNQDPRCTQKPIYTPMFTHHIRS